jgi:hypothetical protein
LREQLVLLTTERSPPMVWRLPKSIRALVLEITLVVCPTIVIRPKSTTLESKSRQPSKHVIDRKNREPFVVVIGD